MTPFSALNNQSAMVKQAFLGKLHNLVRGGIWKSVANKTAPTTLMGRTSRLFHNPLTDKSTTLSKGLTGYGLAGMGTQLFGGPDLPGSSLAMTATTPVLGALFAVPNLINAYRANSQKGRAQLQEDMMTGAREAGSNMLSLGQYDSDFLTRPGMAQQYLQENDPETAGLIERYRKGRHKPMQGLHKFQSLFENSQDLINDRIDSNVSDSLYGGKPDAETLKWWRQHPTPRGNPLMNKQAAFGGALSRGFGHVFPWLFPAMGVAGVASSLASDKPYDELAARRRGYATAQIKMQKELDGLGGMERMALRMDPTLMAGKLEKALPGTLQHWEQQNGKKFQPGLLSGIYDSFNKGENNFYSYDVNGGRKYL